jgi:hypothetical protein
VNSNSASFGRFLIRKRSRVGYDTETEFLVGLVRAKAETLSGIGSGSQVRSSPGRKAGLRQIPYPGWLG